MIDIQKDSKEYLVASESDGTVGAVHTEWKGPDELLPDGLEHVGSDKRPEVGEKLPAVANVGNVGRIL